jgi:hypothetical protein
MKQSARLSTDVATVSGATRVPPDALLVASNPAANYSVIPGQFSHPLVTS